VGGRGGRGGGQGEQRGGRGAAARRHKGGRLHLPGGEGARHSAPMTDHLICHTEASSGFGGQEIRTLAEAAWLVEHGYRTLLICQPGSRILREADLRHLATVPVTMRSALDAGGFLRVRRVLADQRVSLVHTHSS